RASAARLLRPRGVDCTDPRLVVDAGGSADSSGHRRRVVTDTQTGHRQATVDEEPAEILPEQTTEMLAVPSAGALISRALWEELRSEERRVGKGWREQRAAHKRIIGERIECNDHRETAV